MNRWQQGFLVSALVLLGGCEKLKNTPVDVSDTPLRGYWVGEQHTDGASVQNHDRLFIHLRDDGYAAYVFLSCESRDGQVYQKKLDLGYMPVVRLTTTKMVVQSLPLTPKFEFTLGDWPDESSAVWVVDNVPLNPVAAADVPDTKTWQCASGE